MADDEEVFIPRRPERYQFNAIPGLSKGFAVLKIRDSPLKADAPVARKSRPSPELIAKRL
jgi:hypothetical protein